MENQVKEVQLDTLMPLIREKLNMGGEVELPSSGNSMYPLFRHRQDTFALHQLEWAPRKYDMILYQRDNGKYVLHRIVGIGPEGYILRGDNQFENEYPVRADQVIAVVSRFCRNGKQVSCHNGWYRLYAVVWVNTIGLRRGISFVKKLPYRAVRKIGRTLKKVGKRFGKSF